MLLAIDVGNTHTVLGLFEGRKLKRHWRVLTEHSRTADEYSVFVWNMMRMAGVLPAEVEGIIVANVVPPMQSVVETTCRETFSKAPLVVGPGVKTGMPILYDNPREVGADRAQALPHEERFVGLVAVRGEAVLVRKDAARPDAELVGGAHDAHRNFAAVARQELFEGRGRRCGGKARRRGYRRASRRRRQRTTPRSERALEECLHFS